MPKKKKKIPDHTRPVAQDKTRVSSGPRKRTNSQIRQDTETIRGLTKRAREEFERGVRIEETLSNRRSTGRRFITDVTDPEERKAIARKMDRGRNSNKKK